MNCDAVQGFQSIIYIWLNRMGSTGTKPPQESAGPELNHLLLDAVRLVSLPEICVRVGQMVDDPRTSAVQLGRMISQDAALTARLLRIVNSAFYRFPNKVETVSRAIAIIGNRDLRDLVMAASVASAFDRMASKLIDIERFWRHGVFTGIVSRLLASRCEVLHKERLFVAGLIHDIGKLILCFKLPNLEKRAIQYALDNDLAMHDAERHIIGYDHAEVGAELMRHWGLPSTHQATARFHHQPSVATEHALDVAIVYLADRISHLAESGSDDWDLLEVVEPSTWQMTQTHINDVEELLLEAREQFIDTLALFRPRGAADHAA